MRTFKPENTDPLEMLLNKHPFDLLNIKQIASGQKYTGIMLNNGQIGVCANLGHQVNPEKATYQHIDSQNFSHRIILNCYYNALLNYSEFTKESKDISEDIDFKKYHDLVMIGYFKSLVKYLKEEKTPLNIFDLRGTDKNLTAMNDQKKYLAQADAVILTSTSVFNQTFCNIIESTKAQCEIFMLGPSSNMSEEMQQYKKVKKIFGATFSKFDHRIMEIIDQNGGTRDFLKYENKRIFENITNEY